MKTPEASSSVEHFYSVSTEAEGSLSTGFNEDIDRINSLAFIFEEGYIKKKRETLSSAYAHAKDH